MLQQNSHELINRLSLVKLNGKQRKQIEKKQLENSLIIQFVGFDAVVYYP